MSHKKMILIMSSALVIGLLTSCGTGAKTNGSSEGIKTENPKENEIAANFLSNIETKEDKHSIIIKYKVKNISGKVQKLTFSSGLEADFIVYNQAGKKVKQYSDDVMSTQVMKEILLENNQEISKEFTISDFTNGHYKIEVFLTAKEEEAKAVTDLIVKNSFSKGSGELVGLIDNHTVEIDIDGIKTAFQLTEEAQQQYKSLKEGAHVSFVYKENEHEQKVIEKFEVDSK
ncbi:BsuPI-related putative proteinase inhibitor [Neobacillus sp. NPDC093127]|uniref:BsuPI-related putative proteinase inhibitor n=1 Tax=Neobacillus sp. NPDC093127 TaxID=3364296 RepID=UPI0038262334